MTPRDATNIKKGASAIIHPLTCILALLWSASVASLESVSCPTMASSVFHDAAYEYTASRVLLQFVLGLLE